MIAQTELFIEKKKKKMQNKKERAKEIPYHMHTWFFEENSVRNYSQIKKEFRIVLREEKRGNQAKAFFYQPKKYRILEYNKAI